MLFFLTIVVLLGGIELYDILVPEYVPAVNSYWSQQGVSPYHNSSFFTHASKSPEACWADIQMPLKILDEVCPEVSAWARERYESGEIVWDVGENGYYAKMSPYGTLTINECFFLCEDGLKASIIAHEYRHSRQHTVKFLRCAIARIFRIDRMHTLEYDAYDFERKVYLAIFDPLGKSYSPYWPALHSRR